MASPHLHFAKAMRAQPTDAERAIWQMLRAGRLHGLKFKRQVPMGPYIVDFVCFEEMLIVEIDGGQHAGSLRDEQRDAYFAAAGFQTLRVWNNEALRNREGVATAILALVRRRR